MIGALIVAAGYGLNIVLMSEVWHFVIVSCVIGVGIGFTYGSMPALIMGAVPASETAAANSINTLMRPSVRRRRAPSPASSSPR